MIDVDCDAVRAARQEARKVRRQRVERDGTLGQAPSAGAHQRGQDENDAQDRIAEKPPESRMPRPALTRSGGARSLLRALPRSADAVAVIVRHLQKSPFAG